MSSASGLSSLRQLSQWKVVGGLVRKFLHASSATQTEMKFSIFLPPSLAHTPAYASGAAKVDAKVPALYWLSGLTCTDDNFMHKAAAFRAAAAANVALICPDTSPRGANLGPEEKASWDFGEGAGFYLNATSPTYAKHYNMHDYVVNELPQLIEAAGMGVDAVARRSIFGHSMVSRQADRG
jgi:S-formylglutathione hydrolase